MEPLSARAQGSTVSISIGSNIAALQAQRRVADSSRGLQQTFERLSSGLRINRAGDDAAGLAISESLKADSRVYNQGIRNLNDGLGLTNIADSALENLSTIVTRLKELAEQAANGVYGASQRVAIDKEAQKLSAEFSRIVNTTQFNGQNLLTASFGNVTVQGGYGVNGGIQGNLGGAAGTGAFGAATSYDAHISGGSDLTAGLEFVDLNKDGILDMLSVGSMGTSSFHLSGSEAETAPSEQPLPSRLPVNPCETRLSVI